MEVLGIVCTSSTSSAGGEPAAAHPAFDIGRQKIGHQSFGYKIYNVLYHTILSILVLVYTSQALYVLASFALYFWPSASTSNVEN